VLGKVGVGIAVAMITKAAVYQPEAPTSNYCGNQHFESDTGLQKTGIAGVLVEDVEAGVLAEDVIPCIPVAMYRLSRGILLRQLQELIS
jgi:hypothetical protein